MKFFIVALALVAVAAAQQKQENLAAVVRQSQDISPEGSYQYSYETDNGIVASEQGNLVKGLEQPAIAAQGNFEYTAPDGARIRVSYVADENGFQPQGDHLPQAPAVPEAIQRSLEYNAAHPEQNEQ